jgi:acyl-CoA thioesterase-1
VNNPLLDKLVRFQHPDRVLPFARGLSDQTLASIFGTDETSYRTTLERLGSQVAHAASELAADPGVRADLARVPFEVGAHIVALGESTTADRLSWFEILRALLERERPELQLRFDNLAVTGSTTTQALASVPAIRRQSADWIVCLLGTNDSQRLGDSPGVLLVSRPESLRNLNELRAQASGEKKAHWTWITPTPVDEARVAQFPFFRSGGISWANADIAALAGALPELGDAVVDSAAAVAAAGADAFEDDGIHVGIATHAALAALVLRSLGIGASG